MTRKVLFLPGMGSRNGAHDVRVVTIQFERALRRWVEEKPGIKSVNVYPRGIGPGRWHKTVCAIINVSRSEKQVFPGELRAWMAKQPSIYLADAKFSKVLFKDGSCCLKAVFRILEGDGRVRLRPVRRGSRSRQKPISVITTRPLQPDQQEPASALVV